MDCLLGGSMVGLTCCACQVCCSQRPCPHGKPLLTYASAGDTQTLKGKPGSVSVGPPGVQKFLFGPSENHWCMRDLTLNPISPLLPSCWGSSFSLGHEVSFFGEIQHSPVDGCSGASCKFGVLMGEDESMFFYSTILGKWKLYLLLWARIL